MIKLIKKEDTSINAVAIQFVITKSIQCKFGVAYKYNGSEIIECFNLPKLNIHFDNIGAFILIGEKKARVNDYIVEENYIDFTTYSLVELKELYILPKQVSFPVEKPY